MPILPAERDPALITVRRGGTLTDDDHRLLALWAAECSDHVRPLFEAERPDDPILRATLDVARGWVRGDLPMKEAHQQAFRANAAGKGLADPARFAALAAGQAVAVAHVAAHDLGAAAYAIRAAAATAPPAERDAAGAAERAWQRERIPAHLRDAVLADQRARSSICWGVFDDLL